MEVEDEGTTPAGGAVPPAPPLTAPMGASVGEDAGQGSVWMHLAIIVALASLVFFFRLGVADWRDSVDTHQGLIVMHIMAGDGWVLPLRNGRHLPDKPPLFSWLGALSATVRGSGGDLLDARLPSALAALAIAVLVYGVARGMAGGPVALWSALILITTPQFFITGRDSRVDMVFCAFLTAAFVLTWRVWEGVGGRRTAALAGLCFGLATLGKGPLALVLGVLVFGVTAVVAPPAPGWRVLLAPVPVLLSLGVPAAWYVAATLQQGMAFLRLHLLAENISRAMGGQDRSPLWYYVEPLISMGLPWTVALPATVAGTSALPTRFRRFLWVWVTVMFVFFSLSLGKRRAYLLPLRPALAILLAAWLVPQLSRLRSRERTAPPPASLHVSVAGIVGAGLVVALALGVGLGGWGTASEQWSYWWRLYVREYPGTIVAFAIVVGLGVDQVLHALWQRRIERAAYAFVFTLAVGSTIAVSSDAIVRGEAASFRPLAREISAAVARDEALAFFDTDDESAIPLQFHLRRHVGVAESVGGGSCTPPRSGAYLVQERLWEARGCAGDPGWQVIARGGPEVRSQRERRLVVARYAPPTMGSNPAPKR